MPYTYTSLASVWFISFGLVALSASGVLPGPWLILFLLVALGTPALILRRPAHSAAPAPQLNPVRVIAGSRRRPRALSRAFDRSAVEIVGIDVELWENEGGAPRSHVSSGL